tara:strand:- start:1345 stop:1680 length:336 start_codon:yes stop_codon:yes gene_type:complete
LLSTLGLGLVSRKTIQNYIKIKLGGTKMVREFELDPVPDRVRRPCRVCGGDQPHYRMGEPEVDELGMLCVEFQCMGCMGINQMEFGFMGATEEGYIKTNANIKRSNPKSTF